MEYYDDFKFDQEELEHRLPALKPEDYIIDEGLFYAAKLAMMLKQPLLLTGKPGTGKTRLAHKLASDLQQAYPEGYISVPLIFHTKTTSAFSDLFYTYDALDHFHDVTFEATKPEVSKYISLQPLGQAIMLANNTAHPYKAMKQIAGNDKIKPNTPYNSVVLIDEVDKAPRDFANDLLNELDELEFTIKEDEHTTFKLGKGKIFLILTSNSEKSLPDAFLRRCLFYHIQLPGPDLLKKIVLKRLFNTDETAKDEPFHKVIDQYLKFYNDIQTLSLKKQPATAELISWMFYLRPHILAGTPLKEVNPQVLNVSLGILAKQSDDVQELKEKLKA